MNKIAIAALFSVFVTAPAFAADATYIGVKLGRSDTSEAYLTDKKDTSYGIFAGVKFNPNFAFEAEYSDLGNVHWTGNLAQLSEWGLDAVGIIPLNANFSAFGKLGLARSRYQQAVGGTGKRTAPTYGLGAQYDINPTFGVRFGWDRYGVVDVLNNKANTDTWALAGIVKF